MALKRADTGADVLPSVRTLRAMVREWKNARRPRHRPWTIVTEWGVPLYVGGGILWWVWHRPSTAMTAPGSPVFHLLSGSADSATVQWFGWASTAILAAMFLQLFRALGPVASGSAEMHWMLSAPTPRRPVLAPRICGLAVSVALVGLGVGRLVSAFTVTTTRWWMLGAHTAVIWIGLFSIAVLGQIFAPVRRGLTTMIGILWGAGLSIVVLREPSWLALVVPSVIAGALFAAALRWCGRITRIDLSSGADLSTAVSAAVVTLDPSYLSGVLENKKWRRLGAVTSRPFRGYRLGSLIGADLRRIKRDRGAWAVFAAAATFPYVVGVVSAPVLVVLTQLVMCCVVGIAFSAGLRDVCRSAQLRFVLGGSDTGLRICHLLVPAVAIIGVWLVSVPAAGQAGWVVLTLAPIAALAAVYRMRSRPPLDYGGLLLETAVGQLPVDLLRQLLTGPVIMVAAGAAQTAMILSR